MTYSRFEDLPVWNDAVELKLDVDDLCEQPLLRSKRNWIDQIDRAGLSISNNIAEGFERGSTNELLMFLYIARGSAGETRSMLRLMSRKADRKLRRLEGRTDAASNTVRSQITHLKAQIERLIPQAEGVSRQIRGWADSLQNSDIAGQRHLTEQSRKAFDQERRATAFWNKIQTSVRERFERERGGDAGRTDDEPQGDKSGT